MPDSSQQYHKKFLDFLTETQEARESSELTRDFVNLQQWTNEEAQTLLARKQQPVVFDYMREQLDYFQGMERDHRKDPKAFPRNHSEQDEGGAQAATDALRYIADANDFEYIVSDVFEDILVEGYGAALIDVKKKGKDFNVQAVRIPWDRFYYDPHSRQRDFSDATWMGIVIWMNADAAKEKYPKSADIIKMHMGPDGGSETFDDRPRFFDSENNRVRVCEHYYLDKGKWTKVTFAGEIILVEPKTVKFVDEDGEPVCPIVAQSAYVDRENRRYGYFKRLIDPQREINARRSKALHLLSARQVIYEEGAVQDIGQAQRELAKPDGAIKVNPGGLSSGTFQVSPTGDMAQGQVNMYQDAVGKMQASGANAAMQGDVEGLSGRAIQRLQQGGTIQVGSLFDSLSAWKVRVYRQMWFRVKQFWDEEKWIRITDEEKKIKWVGLNQSMTNAELLQEKSKEGDKTAAMALQKMIETSDPRLEQEAIVRNNTAELDVDIILDEVIDMTTSREEEFKTMAELAKLYGPEAVPFKAMVELSSMPNKDKVNQILEGDEDDKAAAMQAQEAQQKIAELERQLIQAKAQADIQNTNADTAKKASEAELNAAKTLNEQADTGKTLVETEQIGVATDVVALGIDPDPQVTL